MSRKLRVVSLLSREVQVFSSHGMLCFPGASFRFQRGRSPHETKERDISVEEFSIRLQPVLRASYYEVTVIRPGKIVARFFTGVNWPVLKLISL